MIERLKVTLTLRGGSKAHKIPGGNVRRLSVAMTTYGAEGSIEFVLQDDTNKGGKYRDELLAEFVKPELWQLELSLQAARQDSGVPTKNSEIVVSGVVLEREVEERVYSRSFSSPSVLWRRYRVTFRDPAAALWRQHFPCDLLTQKSFSDAIEAHRGTVAVTCDWGVIKAQVPLIFFHLSPERGASFYDLVIWCLRRWEGVLCFDPRARSYSIKGEKTAAAAVRFAPGDVLRVSSCFAEVPRYVPRVKNSYTEGAKTAAIENKNAASGVYQDILMRTPVAKKVDDKVALEKSRPLEPLRELEVKFARFPTRAPVPNAIFSFPPVGQGPLASPEEFRVIELSFEARARDKGPEAHYGKPTGSFDVTLSARFESKDDRRVRLPEFVPPTFPGFVEGKVVSEVGKKTELTYKIYSDDRLPGEHYEVKVPLFQDQIVAAPYEPYTGAGALYLPLYKGERVLLALDFDRARVEELLDWRGEARVPQGAQGQQLFLGKNAKSSTSLLHDYPSENPVFRILRTNQNDTALLKLEEGKLTLKVEEKTGS